MFASGYLVMAAGIEVYSPEGVLCMDGTGRYARIIDIVVMAVAGYSGSRTYNDISENDLDFAYFQGGNAVVSVSKTGKTISWGVADSYYFGAFSGAAMLIVVSY